MNLTELIDYIGREWPDVCDANSCARHILKRTAGGPPITSKMLDQLICFWSRHEHD